MRARTALAVLLAAPALAGCLAAPAPEPLDPTGLLPAVEAPDLHAVFAWEHDHASPAEHAGDWNAQRLAWLAPGVEGQANVVHGELDLWGDVLFAGVGHGFMVYDVSDPALPVFLHYEPLPDDALCAGDVKAGPGEGLLTVATQCGRSVGGVGFASAGARGLAIYDVTDPAAPVLVSKGPPGTSCHMADVAVVGGERYVYCASLTGPAVFRLVDLPGAPATPVLLNPNAVQEPGSLRHAPLALEEFGPFGASFAVRAHDMTTQDDPLTGDPIVVVSHSYAGVRILDGRDPTLGTVLGAWAGEGAGQYSWIHTAMAHAHDGRRIVVAITENVVDTPPRLWVLDFTDWAAPAVLAEYALAEHDDSHGLAFSLHNFQVVGTRLYIAAYHAGFWVLDLSDPAKPQPLAYARPQETGPYEAGDGTFFGIGDDWVTQVWDVVVKDGFVLASDMRSGLYSFRVAGDPHGDPAWRSWG